MNENNNEDVLKIVIIGEASVGKTSIINQFIDRSFQDDMQTTVGGSYSSKMIECNNNKVLKLDIWDTAGQERYRCVTKMFYKDADVALLIYDITQKTSFEELKNFWVEQVTKFAPGNIMIVIVGNKSDLFENEQVNEEEARKYAKEINACFFLASAKSTSSVNELFKSIAKKYTGASEARIMEDSEDNVSFRKIRKDSVRVKAKDLTKKKKKKICC